MATETTTRGEAYHTGYESAVQGESRETNPYPVGTWDADEWYAGYDGDTDVCPSCSGDPMLCECVTAYSQD